MGKFLFRRESACDRNSPSYPEFLVLATQAADQATLLVVMLETYVSLEKLVSHESDLLERSEPRRALGSLMRSLNSEMARQATSLVETNRTLCERAAASGA